MIKINTYNQTLQKYLPLKQIERAVNLVAEREIKLKSEISVILCTDEYIHKLNSEFLSHDYTTDVITFVIDQSPLEAEIYISSDTAKMQADDYKVSLKEELLRLAIHGTLHLAGYDDATDDLRQKMSEMENKYLNLLKVTK